MQTTSPRIHLRPVAVDDAPALLALARQLDTLNLPNDPAAIDRLIAGSQASFAAIAADGPDDPHAAYTLVAASGGRLLGTASLFARHGTPDEPHYYLRIVDHAVTSQQLGATRQRRSLVLGKDTAPWTELGGLVVHPDARGRGLGTLLVHARLLLVAAHRQRFCDRLLAELLPPRRADGGNAFWDAIGAPLTGLDYYRADLLCRTDKEFIEAFFPHSELSAELLPPAARGLIGQEGPATAPVRAILRKAGFAFLGTIDPFDAGPHDGCAVADCLPIGRSRRLVRLDLPPDPGCPELLVMNPSTHACERVPAAIAGDGLRLAHEIAHRLALHPGDPCWAMP